MKKILFIGMPGSGKGEQASLLEKKGFKHISTGEIIRHAVKDKDPIILSHKEHMNSGGLLSDELIFDLIEKNTKNLEGYKGYILDGAVRNLNQAKVALKKELIDEVFFFSLSKDEALKRLKNRINTSKVKREDDTLQAFEKRFQIYKEQTQPILKYLKNKVSKYHEIDAFPSIEDIHKKVLEMLDK
ncbi:MAG: nucleoside monophosphate kinase [archaeon]